MMMGVRKYWALQLAGWGAYSCIGILINLTNGARLAPLLVTHACFIAASIGLTHLFRAAIHRRRTPDVPIARMWPFLAACAVGISVIQLLLVIGMNVVLTGGRWPLTSVVALWWGLLLATGIWTVLYVRFAERDRHAARERQLQLTLHEAELRALEAQINPHFLFNSLNSIRALVVVDPPRAQDMLTRLANVLRNTLRHDRQHTVTLAVEMQGVDDYLALEAARLDERLRVECSIDAAAADCAVPPLLVHTLVENAIKHGIAVAPAGGVLVVRARVDGSMLQLDVENTGCLSRGESSGSRLGLTNVRERLRLLYDGRASVMLGERQGMVTATVRIPCGA
jgi:hypothetical protein